MNGLLLIIFCAAASLGIGTALVWSLRKKLRRGPLVALGVIVPLMVAAAAFTPFALAINRINNYRDWQVLKVKRASSEELEVLRRSFPAMTGQADREIYHHYGRFVLAVTEFETDAAAEAFRKFRLRQTMNLHFANGNRHIEIYSRHVNLTTLIWAEFKPDPVIRRYAGMIANGILFWRVTQETEFLPEQMKYLYKALTNYGQLNMAELENPGEPLPGWSPLQDAPVLLTQYFQQPDEADQLELLLTAMRQPIPEHFCPPEIFEL